MVADSNSQIAWHRAQIKKHRETLKHLETARFSYGAMAGSHATDRNQSAAELRRKIGESERIVAAYRAVRPGFRVTLKETRFDLGSGFQPPFPK